MELKAEQFGSALVLHLDGSLGAESDAAWLADAVQACSAPGVRHALLDLARVRRLDCAGIGLLLSLREQVHRARRTFGLIAVERRQKRLLELSGLHHVFRVFDDVPCAASALGLGGARSGDATAEPAEPASLPDRGRSSAGWRPSRTFTQTECLS